MPRQGSILRRRDESIAPPDVPQSIMDPHPEEAVPEAPPELEEDVAPAGAPEPLEAAFPETEELPPPLAPKAKRGRLLLQLVLLAIFGLAVGFTTVMLI